MKEGERSGRGKKLIGRLLEESEWPEFTQRGTASMLRIDSALHSLAVCRVLAVVQVV